MDMLNINHYAPLAQTFPDQPERIIVENTAGTRIRFQGMKSAFEVICVNDKWECDCPVYQTRRLLRSCEHVRALQNALILNKAKACYRQDKIALYLGDIQD